MRGARVQAVVNELQGEKVDIIQWNPDAASFIVNALAPAEVTKVVLDEDSNRIEVVVPEAQLSLAIGRRGQNVRLASQLTGWDIDILTEQEESERRQKEFAERTQLFMDSLDVDEVIAQLLVTEGFATIEEVAYVDSRKSRTSKVSTRPRPSRSRAGRANISSSRKPSAMRSGSELGVADDLAEIPGITTAMMVAFGENGIKTVEDFAGCRDRRSGRTGPSARRRRTPRPSGTRAFSTASSCRATDVENMIMAARVHAGWIKAEDLEQPAAEAEDPRPRRRTTPASLADGNEWKGNQRA